MRKSDIEKGFEEILGRPADLEAISFYMMKDLGYEQFCEILKKSEEYEQKYGRKEPSPSSTGLLRNSFARWPYTQLFVATNIKVLYCPIAKNACSSLKKLMVEISDIPNREEISRRGDIHTQTDKFNTGIQLKDLSESEAREALYSDEYFRFAVLRDPASRLLSAYWEKFVVNRMDKGNLQHTLPVICAIHEHMLGEEADADIGITFAQFVNYIKSTPADKLDTHWKHQSKYVENINISAFYDQKNLTPLYERLSDLCGYEISPNKSNVSNSGKGEFVAQAYDMLPSELIMHSGVSKESFFSKSIISSIKECYKKDYELLEMCEV